MDMDGENNSDKLRPPLPSFALGGLKSVPLKKAPEKIRFVDKELSLSDERTWQSTATTRIRFIDELRMYSPTPDDCSDLNIPEDRLNLHVLQDILYLCGGCAGARFSGDEFKLFQRLGSSLDPLYQRIDQLFKSLPSALKNRKLDGPYVSSSSSTDVNHQVEPADIGELVSFHRLLDDYILMLAELQSVVRRKHEEVRRDSEHKGIHSHSFLLIKVYTSD